MIKRFTLIALVAVVATLFACKKDKAEKNTDRLVGKWNMNHTLEVLYENGKEIDRDEDDGQGQTVEFKSDGTGVSSYDDGSENFKWSATATELKITEESDSEADVYTIKSLSKTELVLVEEYVEVEGNTTYREVVETKFTKK